MSNTHRLAISPQSIICNKCTSLISKLVTCQGCHDTIPLISTFSPDIHLTRKFNTGLATSTEIAALHTQLTAANQLLRTYDFLVDTLERSATQVYRLVKFYSAYIKQGFKSLPPELLALVFQFAAAGQYNSVFAYDDLEIESPSMAISQVCQNWRRIAVHTPALWRDIAVRAPPDWIPTSTETRLARKEILALYIQRAQDTQLNVKFGIQRLMQINSRFKDTELEFEIICRALAPCWDSVSCLQIYSRAPVGITLPLRHLKELTINGFQTPRCYDDLGFNTPGALPALRKLVIPTLPENIDSAHSPLGVTSLTIHSVSRGTFSSSMSWWNRLPNLQELILDWPNQNDTIPLPLRSLKLPILRHLELPSRGMNVQSISAFGGLDLFDVPDLKSLEIYSTQRHHLYHSHIKDSAEPSDVVDPYHLFEFFERSTLCTSLVLVEVAISPGRLHEILSKLTNLCELKLGQIFYTCKRPGYISEDKWETLGVLQYRASIGNQFFAMLAEVDAEFIPLHISNLRRLEIETPSTGLDSNVFLHFLHVRLDGRESLSHLEILFQYQPLPQSLVRDLGLATQRFREANRDGALVIKHQIPKTVFRKGSHSGAPITRRVV